MKKTLKDNNIVVGYDIWAYEKGIKGYKKTVFGYEKGIKRQ
jgi:hypothetical protein